MEKKIDPKFPEYGTPGWIFDLRWHDEVSRDYLIIVDAKRETEVMNARAKGTRVYELIDIYGGIDNVSEVFTAKNDHEVYGDFTNSPEFANDSEYMDMLADLKAKVSALERKTVSEQPIIEEVNKDE